MKALLSGFVITCVIALLCTSTALVAAENPEKPRLDDAQLTVSPTIQGVGGTLNVQTFARINGTC